MAFIFCRDQNDIEQFINTDRVYSISISPDDDSLYRFYTTPDKTTYILAQISKDSLLSQIDRDHDMMKHMREALVAIAQELADIKNPLGK